MGKADRDPGGPLGRALPFPGLAYAAERLARTAFPKVTITPPAPGIRFERDVAVPMHDGVRLRVNVFRPDRAGGSRSS